MPRPLVAISVSGSPDAARLGFDEVHLHRLSADLAELFLSLDFDLAYGGDLRGGGFTETLVGLVSRQARGLDMTEQGTYTPRLVSYLAWPFVETLTKEDEATLRHTCKFRPVLPGELGWDTQGLDWKRAISRDTCTPRDAWITTTCLTRMRHVMSDGDDTLKIPKAALRIVLGGRTTGMQGLVPGVVEEAKIAIEDDTPLIVLGGFGGGGEALGRAIFERQLSDAFEVDTQKQFPPFDRLLAPDPCVDVTIPDVHAAYAALRARLLDAAESHAVKSNGLSDEADLALAGVGADALGVGDEEHILQIVKSAALAIRERHAS